MKNHNELEVLKREYLDYLEKECDRSTKTIENYDRYLTRFLLHTKVKTPKAITESVVQSYSEWLNKQMVKPYTTTSLLKKNTQNYYLIALRGFLKYLHETGLTSLNPKRVALTKTSEYVPEHVTETELERLLTAPNGKDLKSMRDRALLHLLFSTGLRVSEVCTLQASLNLSRNTILVHGKGGVTREVFLSSEAKDAVQTYRDARVDQGEALFVNNGKRVSDEGDTRLSARSVQRIVRFYAIKAGIQKKVTPHVLRHTFASNLVHSGVELPSVQNLLGHMHISSTQMYSKNVHTLGRSTQKSQKKK